MTFLRKTSWRAWAMAVFGAVLGMLAAILAARIVAGHAQSEAAAELQRAARDVARCEADPENWVVLTRGAAYIFAYDGETLASQHRNAPPYAGPRAPELGVLEVTTRGVLGGPLGGAALVLRASERGPCAVIQLTWPSRIGREVAISVGASVMAITLISIGVLGFFVVVRPLLSSIRVVSEAALHVGDPDRYREPKELESEELDAIVKTLSASNARLVAADERVKDQMQALERHLAEIAHDLRTPLTALQLCVEEALDRVPEDPVVNAALTTALQESLYLTALTENLRLVARRRETGSYGAEVWVLDLRDVVERVASRLAILSRRKKVRFSSDLADEQVLVRAMPLAVERCIGNLVENAVVHGPPGGSVSVSLSSEQGEFSFLVWNDVALPAGDRGQPGSRTGSGLGLRITREICAESGWRLVLSSSAQGGTRVSVSGPVEALT